MVNPNDSAIKFNPRRDGEGDYRSVNNPKSNSPAPSKPFKDLMDKDNEGSSLGKRQLANRKDILEEDDLTLADADAPTPSSIFELGSQQTKKTKALKDAPAPSPFALKGEEAPVADKPLSPAMLYQTMTKDETKAAFHSHVSNETANLEGKIVPSNNKNTKINPFEEQSDILVKDAPIEQPAKKDKEKFTSPFAAKEQPDLSYVNPLNQQAAAVERVIDSTPQKPLSPTLSAAQIVEQITHHMEVQQFKAQGLTNTTVTLNYPNMFKDAQVIVTSFDTARNQFNITFQNLGAQAKALLDQQATQDSLKHALEVKGYMVHIITATTNIDQPIITDARDQYSGGREDQPRDQGQGKRKREDEQS